MAIKYGVEGDKIALFFADVEFEEVVCFVFDYLSGDVWIGRLYVPKTTYLEFLSVVLACSDFVFGYVTFWC